MLSPAKPRRINHEDAGWFLVEHACRICSGRLLWRPGPNGGGQARCAECGAKAVGEPRNLCWCGAKTATGKNAGLRCVRNPERTPQNPNEVIVVPVEEADMVVERKGVVTRYVGEPDDE
ncbi:hypothetical protein [Methylomagnum ishizawai]|uniref:hypothetical protein n=1 Tax=Methylomagnum ishizawai TaxID=1760988 RepID=UPI001C3366EB|nr:hypothetical protein [Methylomagnum ishizawai]BBL75446.1 hypothetical protein MishRS11D_25440 [Methylomagnum ishizawai]